MTLLNNLNIKSNSYMWENVKDDDDDNIVQVDYYNNAKLIESRPYGSCTVEESKEDVKLASASAFNFCFDYYHSKLNTPNSENFETYDLRNKAIHYLPPLILVKPGHSFTVIGIEYSSNKQRGLIITDTRSNKVIEGNKINGVKKGEEGDEFRWVDRLDVEEMEGEDGWEVFVGGGEELKRFKGEIERGGKRGREGGEGTNKKIKTI